MKDELLEKVRSVIEDVMEIPRQFIKLDSHFGQDLLMDSIEMMKMITCLEEEIGRQILDEEVEKLTTVQEAIDLLMYEAKVQ